MLIRAVMRRYSEVWRVAADSYLAILTWIELNAAHWQSLWPIRTLKEYPKRVMVRFKEMLQDDSRREKCLLSKLMSI